jgi:CheY-like chemotaxis protein
MNCVERASWLRLALAAIWVFGGPGVDLFRRRMNVLVAANGMVDRSVIAQTLRHKFPQLDVKEVGDGQQAIAMCSPPPDLLITGLQMPNTDGYQLIKWLRGGELTRGVPVMVVSANATPSSITRVARMGIDGFLVRPFQIENLVSNVEAILRRHIGLDSIEALPRNAVRREIVQTVYVHWSIRALAPDGFCVPSSQALIEGDRLICDLREGFEMLGLAPPPRASACVVVRQITLQKEEAFVIRPVADNLDLIDAIDRRLRMYGRDCETLMLTKTRADIRLPVQTVDLSATGIKIVSPVAFPLGARLRLSLDSLTAPLYSQCDTPRVMCGVVRSDRNDGAVPLGLSFEEAPPQLIGDILQWSTGA